MVRCGNANHASESCQCDAGCGSRGDCCADYGYMCGANGKTGLFDKLPQRSQEKKHHEITHEIKGQKGSKHTATGLSNDANRSQNPPGTMVLPTLTRSKRDTQCCV